MDIQDIIRAWNAQADEHNQWYALGGDEMVEFALRYVEKESRVALDDLCQAIYSPRESGMSITHAMRHVRQVFSRKN